MGVTIGPVMIFLIGVLVGFVGGLWFVVSFSMKYSKKEQNKEKTDTNSQFMLKPDKNEEISDDLIKELFTQYMIRTDEQARSINPPRDC